MGKDSGVSWCDHTWNPWQGCRKVSSGCLNCYMYRDKKRYGQDQATVVRSKPGTFNAPMKWKDQAKVFVCSWSDFFIEDADAWRDDAWEKGYIEMAWCACGCGNRFKPQLGKKYYSLACKRKIEIQRQKERREKKVKKVADPNRQNKGFWGNMPTRTAAQQQAALDAIPGPTALERIYCRGPENEMDTKI